jgi:hypothetical protein
LIIGAVGLVLWPWTGLFVLATVPWGVMMLIPISGTFKAASGCKRQSLAGFAVLLGATTFLGLGLGFIHPLLVLLPLIVLGVAVMFFTLAANILFAVS